MLKLSIARLIYLTDRGADHHSLGIVLKIGSLFYLKKGGNKNENSLQIYNGTYSCRSYSCRLRQSGKQSKH
jgi:hypothetical protein